MRYLALFLLPLVLTATWLVLTPQKEVEQTLFELAFRVGIVTTASGGAPPDGKTSSTEALYSTANFEDDYFLSCSGMSALPPQHNYPTYEGIVGLIERGWNGDTYDLQTPHRDQPGWNLSTFAVDVDTASYSNVRRFLNEGQLPPPHAVRVEEMVNYFRYNYPQPEGAPLSLTTELVPCPWKPERSLLRVGLQAAQASHQPGRNIVMLVDVSSSMDTSDRLPLLKRALTRMAGEFGERDRLALVTYAGTSKVVLDPTPGHHTPTINEAIECMAAHGGTNGSSGLLAAYELAREHYQEDGINRVLLATDGDFNLGLSSHADMLSLIRAQRESGIGLTVLGVGRGNLNDHMMEQLADQGDGHYAYLDSDQEAHRVLLEQASSTFILAAEEVKVQLKFDPARVKQYRQIGYENRALSAEQFEDERADAGEMGAGHQVTALYEVELAGNDGELGEVRVRYRRPGETVTEELSQPIISQRREGSDIQFAAAVAETALALRGHTRASLQGAEQTLVQYDSEPVYPRCSGIADLVKQVRQGKLPMVRDRAINDSRHEFRHLLKRAIQLKDQLASSAGGESVYWRVEPTSST